MESTNIVDALKDFELLMLLLPHYDFRYVDMFGLANPSDNINFVMRQLANELNATISGSTLILFLPGLSHLKKFSQA